MYCFPILGIFLLFLPEIRTRQFLLSYNTSPPLHQRTLQRMRHSKPASTTPLESQLLRQILPRPISRKHNSWAHVGSDAALNHVSICVNFPRLAGFYVKQCFISWISFLPDITQIFSGEEAHTLFLCFFQ